MPKCLSRYKAGHFHWSGTAKLNYVLHGLNITHNLVSISSLSNNSHSRRLTKRKGVVRRENTVVGTILRTNEMHTVEMSYQTNDHVVATPKMWLHVGWKECKTCTRSPSNHGVDNQKGRWSRHGHDEVLNTARCCSLIPMEITSSPVKAGTNAETLPRQWFTS